MKNYKFGFSLKGFIAFILVMIPNIVWMIIPPNNDIIAENSSFYPAINMLEYISQGIMIALLIIIISKKNSTNKSIKFIFISLSGVFLVGYYILWIYYYIGTVSGLMLVGMAVLPSFYFIFVEIWLNNYIAIIPSIIFGIVHISITSSNYL